MDTVLMRLASPDLSEGPLVTMLRGDKISVIKARIGANILNSEARDLGKDNSF